MKKIKSRGWHGITLKDVGDYIVFLIEWLLLTGGIFGAAYLHRYFQLHGSP